MRVLVTGVAGFIGSHVAQRLAGEGHEVIGVDDMSVGREENIPSDIEFIETSLALPGMAKRLPGRIDAILHLAGQSSGEISFDDPVGDLSKNVVSTLNLIRYGTEVNAQRLVYASSMSVYGSVPDEPIGENHACNPMTCYGVGKLAAERYVQLYSGQLPSTVFRMFNVYGPGQDLTNDRQGMVSIFVAQAVLRGEIIVRGSLDRFRDFIHIDDVVEAWTRSVYADTKGTQILNLGTGRRCTVGALLECIREHVPGISWQVASGTRGDQVGIYCDPKKLQKLLGISSFVPLDAGLKDFVSWASSKISASSHD